MSNIYVGEGALALSTQPQLPLLHFSLSPASEALFVLGVKGAALEACDPMARSVTAAAHEARILSTEYVS